MPIYMNIICNTFLSKTATGDTLSRDTVTLQFMLTNIPFEHTFFIADNLYRNIILGHNFIAKNNCKVFDNVHILQINGQNIFLEDDNFIASFVRSNKTITLPPKSSIKLQGKLKDIGKTKIIVNKYYEIATIDTGFFSKQSGLNISSTVAYLDSSRKSPLILTNTSTLLVIVTRGCIIGKLFKLRKSPFLGIPSCNNATGPQTSCIPQQVCMYRS